MSLGPHGQQSSCGASWELICRQDSKFLIIIPTILFPVGQYIGDWSRMVVQLGASGREHDAFTRARRGLGKLMKAVLIIACLILCRLSGATLATLNIEWSV